MKKLAELMFGPLKGRDLTDTQSEQLLDSEEVMIFNRDRVESRTLTTATFLKRILGLGASGISWVLGADHKFYVSGTPEHPVSGWRDIIADMSAGRVAGANVPAWDVFRNGILTYQFSATAMKEIWITFHINHDYAVGTKLYPHVHFSPTTTDTGVVRWGIEYTWAQGHDQMAFGATNTVYMNYNIATNKQYQHLIAEVTDGDALSLDGLEVDSLLLCRIFRDAADGADTFPAVVAGLTVDIHYQANTFATLNKAPSFYS